MDMYKVIINFRRQGGRRECSDMSAPFPWVLYAKKWQRCESSTAFLPLGIISA
jgi:hypothetical protein